MKFPDEKLSPIKEKLTDSAYGLFDTLLKLHNTRPEGAVSEFHRREESSINHNVKETYNILQWRGAGSRANEKVKFSTNDLYDLLDLKLLDNMHITMGGGGPMKYRISGLGEYFYEWKIKQSSPHPVAQIEHVINPIIDNPGSLLEKHSQAAEYLSEAFEHLWTPHMNTKIIKNIGSSLRNSLTMMAKDLAGNVINPEKPADALKPYLEKLEEKGKIPLRYGKLLTSMIAAAAASSQRLSHAEDEASKGRPEPTKEEVRRTAFAVALCCYELNTLPR